MNLRCTRGAPQEYQDLDLLKFYVSNSQVITVLDPDAFRGIDPFVLAAAQQRGTDLHVIFALRMLAEVGIGEAPTRPSGILGGYDDAIVRFIRERTPRAERVEQSSVNDELGFAGTFDFKGWLNGVKAKWLIDLKTGPERAVHSAQLHGYKKLKGNGDVENMGSLYIRKNGTYRLVEHTHSHIDWAWFMGGLNVLNGRRYHGIK